MEESESRESAEALYTTLWIGAPFKHADFEQRIAAQNQVAVVPKPNDVKDFTYFTWFLHRDRHVLYGLGVKDGKISSKRILENGAWRDLP